MHVEIEIKGHCFLRIKVGGPNNTVHYFEYKHYLKHMSVQCLH